VPRGFGRNNTRELVVAHLQRFQWHVLLLFLIFGFVLETGVFKLSKNM
jgi:hypothetical protein